MSTNTTEAALKDLAGGRKRVAVIYDEDKGWCVSDDMYVLAPEYRVNAYRDWFCETLDDALEKLRHDGVLRAEADAALIRNRRASE